MALVQHMDADFFEADLQYMRLAGKRLRLLRKKQNKSQQLVADFCGIHQTTLGEYERGVCLPRAAVLVRLADYYNVSLDYILGRHA